MNPAPTSGPAARALCLALVGLTAVSSTGCATLPGATPPAKEDPWESFNRKVFAFNDVVDETALKPVATAYRDGVPELVRTGVSNFLANVYDVWSVANHFLQGKVQDGVEMGVRVLANTFFGLGGLLDPATEMGITRRTEDFGQTLGRWGLGPGPYLVLPFFGPSTLRDGTAFILDWQASPSKLGKSATVNWGITTLEAINVRANLLGASKLLDDVALDRYTFLRQAYLARRLDLVYDGAPPMEPFEDEGADAPAVAPSAAPAQSPTPMPAKPPLK